MAMSDHRTLTTPINEYDWPGEFRKQAVDQPLHFTWAYATTFVPFINPWLAFLTGFSFAIMIAREISQGDSPRPWDQPLDIFNYILGAISGVIGGLLWVL